MTGQTGQLLRVWLTWINTFFSFEIFGETRWSEGKSNFGEKFVHSNKYIYTELDTLHFSISNKSALISNADCFTTFHRKWGRFYWRFLLCTDKTAYAISIGQMSQKSPMKSSCNVHQILRFVYFTDTSPPNIYKSRWCSY